MTIGRTQSVALLGVDAVLVEVEADIASGLPRFTVVGLPDRSLTESADRVRSAIVNSGVPMPSQRVTVNLSPASLPKAGAGFDLAIAIAALSAAGVIAQNAAHGVVHVGELALDGRLRPTAGVLPGVLGAKKAGVTRVVVPAANAREAGLVTGVEVFAAASLRDVLIAHGARLAPVPVTPLLLPSEGVTERVVTDLSDVVGQPDAVEALVAVAAGGHHLSMTGPPGSGKTMLASRLPGILPPLSMNAALEATSIQSLATGHGASSLINEAPVITPHHTASAVSLIGGGTGIPRPGAIARAHHGVLFLDEAPEFSQHALDCLRQPLESGDVVIHRAAYTARFPARFMLVIAANPCPCGGQSVELSAGAARSSDKCTCTPAAVKRYHARVSGPLADRIDIHIRVSRVSAARLRLGNDQPMTTAIARAKVLEARRIAAERFGSLGYASNSEVPGRTLRGAPWRLPTSITGLIDRGLDSGVLTMRGYDRTLRLAWTLADLDGATIPSRDHIAKSHLLRTGM